MLVHPQFDPIAFEFGIIKIHWYGLMYVLGFLGFLWIGKYRARKYGLLGVDRVDDLVFWGALGVILGGRIGYVVFYGWSSFISDPLFIFKIQNGGMSFHGGLIGVLVAMLLLSLKWKVSFFKVSDFVSLLVPIGLGAGRIGNFINAELWGKATNSLWGMVFPNVDDLPRHPSQLYQAFLEGLVLFLILWFFSLKKRATGQVTALFLIFYGFFRFLVEFVREPDRHIGYLAYGWLTMGQILSFPMIFLGMVILLLSYLNKLR